MNEVSCGIVPLRKIDAEWHVLLVKHRSGNHWSFPKGHQIKGETAKETALRELDEETGLTVEKFLFAEVLVENYQFVRKGTTVSKSVIYFIAEVSGEINLQCAELLEAKWVLLREAEQLITYSESKNVCRKVLLRIEGI